MSGRTVAILVVGVAALAAGGWFVLGGGAGTPGGVDPAADDAAAESAAMGAGFSVRSAPIALKSIAAPTLRIRGTVVDAEGAPLSGVRVAGRRTGAVYDMSDPKSWGDWNTLAAFTRTTKEIDAPTVEEEKSPFEAKSAEDGAFLIEVPEPGNYQISALVDASRIGTRAVAAVTFAKPEAKVRIAVASGSRLVGRVVDAADKGVAAVVKASWTELSGASKGQWAYPPAARTDASGGFAFEVVPAGKGSVSVTLAGRMTLSGIEVTTPHEGTLVIRLGGGGVLKGRVLDLQGRGVAGADVMATIATSAGADSHDATACSARGRSDLDGAWRMEGVLPGRVTALSVAAQGYTLLQQTVPRAPWAGAEVKGGQETVVDIVVKKAGAVAGRVTEVGTGSPLPDVEIRLLRGEQNSAGAPPTTVTDAEGRFRFDEVPLGRHVLLPQSATHWSAEVEAVAAAASTRVYSSDTVRTSPPSLTVVLTTEGETAQRDIELRRGLAVRGRVVGPDGRGVEGARVRSQAALSLQWMWSTSWYGTDVGTVATSGEDGVFEAKGLAPRDAWVLVAAKDPFLGKPCEKFSLAAGAAPPDVVLVLEVGASIAGRVLDVDGKPAGGWNVWYWAQEAAGFQQNTNATTDGDGTFLFQGLPPGKGQLQASGTGGNLSKSVDALTAGEARTGVELRVEKSAQISGTIVDADGKPLSGLSLSSQPENGGGGGSAWTQTRGDGTFTINGSATGRTRLQVNEMTDQGYTQGVWIGDPVQAPASGLRFVYTPKKRTAVTGRVVDPAGRPVPLCTVTTAGGRDRVVYGGNNADEVVAGEFVKSFEGTPPFQLTIGSPRDERGRPLNLRSKQVTVTDPKDPVVVTLEAGQEVAGQVTGPDGKGVQGVTLRTGAGASASSDDDGRFRLLGLGDEPDVEVTVDPSTSFMRPSPVHARPGQKDVAVRLAVGLAIAGRVLGPDGKPIVNGSVQARWTPKTGNQGFANAGLSEGGVFKLEGLTEDVLATLYITTWGDAAAKPRPVQIDDVRPGTSDLVVRMEAGVAIEGRVLYSDGSPAKSSWIGATRVDDERDRFFALGAQPVDGSFTIGGLESGVTYALKVNSPNGMPSAELLRVEAPARNVRLVVPRPARVAGRVEGCVAGASYYVQGWPIGGGPRSGGVSAKADTDGSFSMEVLADTDYQFAVSATAEDRYAVAGPVRAGGADVVLKLQAGLSIEGQVDDLPATGQVWVTAKSDQMWASAGIRDGRFKVRGLPPGRYTLTLQHQTGAGTGSETAEAGSTGIRLRWQK